MEDPLVRLPELLCDHEAAAQTVELPRKLGRPEVRGGEHRDLRVGAAHVDGAARVAAVGAYRDRIVPREPGAGESQRDRGEAGQDAQVLPAEPLAEQAHDAEETGVPRREHDHGSLRVLDPRERLARGRPSRPRRARAPRRASPGAARPPRRARRSRKQVSGLLVERPSIEADDGYAVPAHAGLQAVSSRAPGLAPAGSRVSKSTRMT